MKKIAIQGSQDSNEQKEIIEILKSLGGYNTYHYHGSRSGAYYFIDFDNVIERKRILSTQEYELLTLKEYKEKYMNKENNKELKIEVPQGYEIDKENSTFEKIVFKKVEEKLTYTKIINELFNGKKYYYIDKYGTIKETINSEKVTDFRITDSNNAPTKHQLQRLLATNKLMNVAYYLNNGWEPDWNDSEQEKFYIYYNSAIETINVSTNFYYNNGVVYFKSIKIAEQAIKILGEETIKLALGVL
jgi:hypothetical protein